jgi:hypothetical protein
MIAAFKEKTMERTAETPAAAKPDATGEVVGVGGFIEDSNEAASKADAQVNLLDTGTTGVSDVGAGHDSIEKAADGDGDDSGFNTDKTTDGSGPTLTWTLDEGGKAERSTEPVTTKPFPSGEGTLSEQKAAARLAYDAEPFPSEGALAEGEGSAKGGEKPKDPSVQPSDRVDLLKPVTTPEGNNSGPTVTWTGTDGNGVERQQDPVTNETLVGDEGVKPVKSSAISSHVVKAMKLADLEIDLGLANKDDKYNRLTELGEISEAEVETQLNTLSKVKTAGLRKAPAVGGRLAGRMPTLSRMASVEPVEHVATPDESLFF